MEAHLAAARTAVVITCYDRGDTLQEAYESVKGEAGEVVIVDDGSTDPVTLKVLSGLERTGATVIRRPNGGLSAALMTGVAATSAPYVFRFDADDVLVPGALARLADALDADPRAVVAWGDLETFGDVSYRVPSVPALDRWLVTFVNLLPASSLFRRSMIDETGGWTLPRGGYEDWDLLMTLAERGDYGIYVPMVVYRYRRAATGLIADSLDRFEACYEELRTLHPRLFAERGENRRRSAAPRSLRLAVSAVGAAPLLGTLTKVRLAQLLTHLFWNGGLRAAAPIVTRTLRSR